MKNKPVRALLATLISIIVLVVLFYGYIVIASLWGRDTIQIKDQTRHYRVYVPQSYLGDEPVPVVLVFHMLTASGRTAEWLTHFNQIAEQEGFIVVYPDGYKASWAEGSHLYAADQEQIDDVAFVSALLDELTAQYAVDRERIYATGFSSGGFMAQRLGCDLSDRISAIATVGATLTANVLRVCSPQKPMPVLMIHGLEDGGVPWEGSPDYASVPETIRFWSQHNQCQELPFSVEEPDTTAGGTQVARAVYANCQAGAPVVLYSITGGGHTWPGGSKPVQLWGLSGRISQEMDASMVIWQFFEEIYKQSATH